MAPKTEKVRVRYALVVRLSVDEVVQPLDAVKAVIDGKRGIIPRAVRKPYQVFLAGKLSKFPFADSDSLI